MSTTAGLIKELDTRNYGRIQLPELHHGTTFGWELPLRVCKLLLAHGWFL